MARGGYDTDLDGLLQSRFAGGKSAVGSVGIMSLHRVTKVVGEDGDILHLAYILLQRTSLRLQR